MTMQYDEAARRVHFGRGLLSQAADLLPKEFDGLFVITTDRLAAQVESLCRDLGPRFADLQIGAPMHVPVTDVSIAAEAFDTAGARAVLAVGGGSAIGLGKALARRRAVPLAAIPTTYAGSEMTPVWGETRNGVKRTGRDDAVRPREVIYDVALTESMPIAASVASAFNALAHAMEALYAPDATPVSDAIAAHAVHHLCTAVEVFAGTPESAPEVRDTALQGAWLAGQVLGSTTMSMHHKLCHILGGSYNLPHAQTHAVLLPCVLSTCADSAPDVYETFCRALDDAEPEHQLRRIAAAAGVPSSLQELGLTAADLAGIEASVQRSDDQQHYLFDPAQAVSVLRNAWEIQASQPAGR